MKNEELIRTLADSACAAHLCDQSWETVVRAVLRRLSELGMSEDMVAAFHEKGMEVYPLDATRPAFTAALSNLAGA